MTGWLILIAALGVLAGALRLLGLSRAAWEPVAAAALFGVAGYAWQGQPGLAGTSVPPPETRRTQADAAQVQAIVSGENDDPQAVLSAADRWVAQGLSGGAVEAVRAALDRHPNDPDLWVALGNALVAHNGGVVSPAAQLALRRAATIAPTHPGPPFFLGLAYAQAGQTDQARAEWRRLLARTPPAAPWRADLESKLRQIDGL